MSGVAAILACREERVHRRLKLQKEYGLPAVVLMLNIPGADKCSRLYEKAHLVGEQEFLRTCNERGLTAALHSAWYGACSREALFLIGERAEKLKQLCVGIETHHPLGRIFDFDVYLPDGTAVDRQALELPQRRCFVCAQPARECARLQRHSIEEIRDHIDGAISQFLSLPETH